jgi:hypothetical protein
MSILAIGLILLYIEFRTSKHSSFLIATKNAIATKLELTGRPLQIAPGEQELVLSILRASTCLCVCVCISCSTMQGGMQAVAGTQPG